MFQREDSTSVMFGLAKTYRIHYAKDDIETTVLKHVNVYQGDPCEHMNKPYYPSVI